jgi:16S rRNA (cytidine1402-2'-O)-methyltransferase
LQYEQENVFTSNCKIQTLNFKRSSGGFVPKSTGTLYVVATPIGNLDDVTFRALEVLREVELIAAEDTRRTRKLRTHFDIGAKLISYREQNREKAGALILDHLRENRSAALVTDAGTPGLSDPGHHLVKMCVANNIPIVPVPGAAALTAAISVSGMPLQSFLFEGFLPSRPAARRGRIAEIGAAGLPFIIYESPKRITETLEDIARSLGDREVLVAREMTKIHEEFLRGMASEVSLLLGKREVKGEITVIVAGSKAPGINISVLNAAKRLLKEGLPPSKTAGILEELTGADRKSLYRIIIGLSGHHNQGGNDG